MSCAETKSWMHNRLSPRPQAPRKGRLLKEPEDLPYLTLQEAFHISGLRSLPHTSAEKLEWEDTRESPWEILQLHIHAGIAHTSYSCTYMARILKSHVNHFLFTGRPIGAWWREGRGSGASHSHSGTDTAQRHFPEGTRERNEAQERREGPSAPHRHSLFSASLEHVGYGGSCFTETGSSFGNSLRGCFEEAFYHSGKHRSWLLGFTYRYHSLQPCKCFIFGGD